MSKKLILKGLQLGAIIFLIAEFISFIYTMIIMQLVPSGSSWTPLNGFLTFSTKIVNWICLPFSHVLRLLGIHFWGATPPGVIIKWGLINLIGWTICSTLFLFSKEGNKNN